MTVKLYRRRADDGQLAYHEAWVHDGEVTEHWGVVGDRGETKVHRIKRGEDGDEVVERVLAPARAAGFDEIEEEDHRVLLIEYSIDGTGTAKDLEKRHALQERMDDVLGWTGLGHCDGGSIGSGTMEVCCFVVDSEIARKVTAADLAGTKFAGYTRIFDEGADE